MAAFRRAVDLGARFIETDLQMTRDAQIVALHDPTLDRTTNGHGPVRLLALDEIRELDAGAWMRGSNSAQFAGERVPTLKEILDFSRERDVNFYLEIKSGGNWGIEHALVAALRDEDAEVRVVVLSFDAAALDSVHRFDETLMTGYLSEDLPKDFLKRALQIGVRQIAPRGDFVTPPLVDEAHNAGLQVVTWTINEPAEMRRLITAGVDGIMTDYPDRLVEVLRAGQAK
jgi:glycerophosphoryl diester phosphodiesterase